MCLDDNFKTHFCMHHRVKPPTKFIEIKNFSPGIICKLRPISIHYNFRNTRLYRKTSMTEISERKRGKFGKIFRAKKKIRHWFFCCMWYWLLSLKKWYRNFSDWNDSNFTENIARKISVHFVDWRVLVEENN